MGKRHIPPILGLFGPGIHPLLRLGTTMNKKTPLMLVGEQRFVKVVETQFRNLEATGGWQLVVVHRMILMRHIQFIDSLSTIVLLLYRTVSQVRPPTMLSNSQKSLKYNMPLSLIGWALRETKNCFLH